MDGMEAGTNLFTQLINTGGVGAVLAVAVWYMVKQRDKADQKREEAYTAQYMDSKEREKLLSERLNDIENTSRNIVVGALRDNTNAMNNVAEAIKVLPCNLNPVQIKDVLNRQPVSINKTQ